MQCMYIDIHECMVANVECEREYVAYCLFSASVLANNKLVCAVGSCFMALVC